MEFPKRVSALLEPTGITPQKLRQAMRLLSRSTSVVGLDVGTTSVKGVRTKAGEGASSPNLKHIFFPIPPTTDRRALELETVSAIKGVIDKLGPGIPVHAVVNDPKLFLLLLKLPRMPRRELKEAVLWETRNHLSYPVEEAYLDFQVLGETTDQSIPKLSVLVGALPKEVSESWTRIFSKAGIRPRVLIPLPCALQAWVKASPLADEEGLALIDMGASHSELAIFETGVLQFTRKLPISGNDLTRSLTEVLISPQGRIQLNWEQAERVKKNYGIPPESMPQNPPAELTRAQILSLMGPHIERLAKEIRRSLDSYREESQGRTIRRLVLFGGSGPLPGLPEFLEGQIGVPLALGELAGVSEPWENPHLFEGALAAALSPARSLNLMPPIISEETKRWIERVSIESLAAAALATWLVLFLGFRIKISTYQKRLGAASQELTMLSSQLSELKTQQALAGLTQPQELWRDIFQTLSSGVPSQAHLNSFEMREGAVKITGVHAARGAAPDLTRFLIALEKGGFRKVRLQSLRAQNPQNTSYSFEIICEK